MQQDIIRRMTAADLMHIMRIEETNHPYPWSEAIMSDCFKDNYVSYVYIQDDEIIGYIIQTIAADESNILNVCVDYKFRKNGIAEKLMFEALNYCKSNGIHTVFLEVRSSNMPAINLYNKCAFVEVGVRNGYYPAKNGREDAIVMALEILD